MYYSILAPTLMFVSAFDALFSKIERCHLEKVVAISASGQQHGSVYWKSGSEKTLKTLDSGNSLVEQLSASFSKENSPIWMDSSTTNICRLIENDIGGPSLGL